MCWWDFSVKGLRLLWVSECWCNRREPIHRTRRRVRVRQLLSSHRPSGDARPRYTQGASRGTPRAWWVRVANRALPDRRCSLELGVAREARRFTRWFAHGLPSCHRGKIDWHPYRSFRARRQSLFFAKPTTTSLGFAYRSPSTGDRSPSAFCYYRFS